MTRSPGAKPADAGAEAFDFAGEFGGGRKRERRLVLVFAGDDQGVEKVQRRRLDAHQDFARPRRGLGDVGEFKVVGGPVTGAEQGFHGGSVGYTGGARYLARLPAGLAASELGL